jgi:hypothetical protein
LSIQIAYDCIRANIGRAPAGLLAGYATGSSDICWTAADWAAHPGAVRIDQDPAASDDTADVLDVESGAATLADVPGWSKRALASYRGRKRPGQRSPIVYCSQVNVTPVANVLTGAGLADGSVGLFIANWNLSQVQAVAEVLAASGPFPVHGLQFQNAGSFDIDVFSSAWLDARSGPARQAYGAPRNLTVRAGTGSVLVERCDPPASAPSPTDHYDISVFTGSFPSLETLVYERYMKAAPQQFGSLQDIPSGTHMTLRAVAYTADGTRSAYADASFQMP